MNYRIEFGSFSFNNTNIRLGSIQISKAVDLAGNELAIDTFSASVEYENGAEIIWSPKDYDGLMTKDLYFFGVGTVSGDLLAVPYGTELTFTHGDVSEKYYIKNIVRLGKTLFKLNAVSVIGLLDGQQFMGGLYDRTELGSVLSDIIGSVFSYTVAADVESQAVSGWIPVCSRREALHMLMFAMGCSLTKDDSGNISFVFLRGQSVKSIPQKRLYVGGSIDYNALITAVNVVEHTYEQTDADPTETLFDNAADEDPAVSTFLQFDKPYYDLTVSGSLAIDTPAADNSGVNFAIVSGNGTLTGKPYAHKTRTIRRELNGATGKEKVASTESDHLINAQNSETVARRLLSYYSSRRTVRADLVVEDEQCGDMVSFTDAYGENATGFLQQMDLIGSGIIKAGCRIITDYFPSYFGNFYSTRSLVTASGTWTVPAGVYHLRVVLIPGGNGGDGGEAGTGMTESQENHVTQNPYSGTYTYLRGYTKSIYFTNPGGAGGAGGATGKVFVEDYDVTPGETITVAIGQGGAAGAANGGAGGAGTPTTASSTSLGSLSSADGEYVERYVDLITGDTYCQRGEDGTAGGYGGNTKKAGGDAGSNAGGNAGAEVSGYTEPSGYMVGYYWRAGGGGGGGAAVGHNGPDGGNASRQDPSGSVTKYTIIGGDAADGADADAPTGTAGYGCGGHGGNGGGAASVPGSAAFESERVYDYPSAYPVILQAGAGASGGSGSKGLKGGNGVAIFYYNG